MDMFRSRASASALVVLLAATLVGVAAPATAAPPGASVPPVTEAAQITITGFDQSEGSWLVTVEITGTATCFDSTGTASVLATAIQVQPEFRYAADTITISCSGSPVHWSVSSTIWGGFYPYGINLGASLTDDDEQRSISTSWWYPYV